MDSKMKLRIAVMPIALAAVGSPLFVSGCSELEEAQGAAEAGDGRGTSQAEDEQALN